MPDTTFAGRLRALRAAAGLTQQELADRAGLSRTHVGRLETEDGVPSWPTVCALARALGVGPEKFSEKSSPPPCNL
jgi:transcriptional regulator with XRE-family HTH domain